MPDETSPKDWIDWEAGVDEVCDGWNSNLKHKVDSSRYGRRWKDNYNLMNLVNTLTKSRVNGNPRVPYDRDSTWQFQQWKMKDWKLSNTGRNIFRKRIKIISFGIDNLHELDGGGHSDINLQELIEE